jgi:hypothetical protein
MLPFYQNVNSLIPFDIDELIDLAKITILQTSPVEDKFAYTQTFGLDVLNPEFLKFLCEKDLEPKKVLIWHWLCKDPHIAHIDSNSAGTITPLALNWTLSTKRSQVNFYDVGDRAYEVKHGNEADTSFTIQHVASYIAVDVSGLEPNAIWQGRGPCLLNISKPHMIVAPDLRITVSLQFCKDLGIESALNKLLPDGVS